MTRKYTPREEYTEEQRTTFLELAIDEGIVEAMKILEYPKSWRTADLWAKQRGITPPKSITKALAALNGHALTLEEKLATANDLADAYKARIMAGDLSVDELNKLANGYKKVVETMNLIEGKATSITHKVDEFDTSLIDMLNAEKARNEAFEDSIES